VPGRLSCGALTRTADEVRRSNGAHRTSLHQKRPQQSATNAINLERKLSRINETHLYPTAHNGLVAGSNAFGIDNEINL
jgi:hypothetical protein